MSNKTWLQLESEGWSREINERNNVIYKRPSGTKVTRKRDLSEIEMLEFGDTLFPGKRQKIQLTHQLQQPQPEIPIIPDIPVRRSEVFVVDETEASNEVKGPPVYFLSFIHFKIKIIKVKQNHIQNN